MKVSPLSDNIHYHTFDVQMIHVMPDLIRHPDLLMIQDHLDSGFRLKAD